MKSIDVIYVNFFSFEETLKSIKSLKKFLEYKDINLNVLIKDNSYSFFSKEKVLNFNKKIYYLKDKKFNIKYLPSERNIGFGAACNIAAKESFSEIILFINCDTDFSNSNSDDFFNHISYLINKENNISISGPKINSEEGFIHISHFSFDPIAIFFKPLRHLSKIGKLSKSLPKIEFFKKNINKIFYSNPHNDRPVLVDWLSGCCLFVSRDFFELSGGFDDKYFLYFEDIDLCRKARELKKNVLFDPNLSIIHKARFQSSEKKGVLRSILSNKTTRYHICSWISYIYKWRKDFILKILKRFFSKSRKFKEIYYSNNFSRFTFLK